MKEFTELNSLKSILRTQRLSTVFLSKYQQLEVFNRFGRPQALTATVSFLDFLHMFCATKLTFLQSFLAFLICCAIILLVSRAIPPFRSVFFFEFKQFFFIALLTVSLRFWMLVSMFGIMQAFQECSKFTFYEYPHALPC